MSWQRQLARSAQLIQRVTSAAAVAGKPADDAADRRDTLITGERPLNVTLRLVNDPGTAGERHKEGTNGLSSHQFTLTPTNTANA